MTREALGLGPFLASVERRLDELPSEHVRATVWPPITGMTVTTPLMACTLLPAGTAAERATR